MSEPNLHLATKIVLLRCQNGWLAIDSSQSFEPRSGFVFESTAKLAQNLTRLVGHSGWKIEMPERDEKGHFKPKQP